MKDPYVVLRIMPTLYQDREVQDLAERQARNRERPPGVRGHQPLGVLRVRPRRRRAFRAGRFDEAFERGAFRRRALRTDRDRAGRLTLPDGPIHVDFIAPAAHRLPGRLGLTIAPGKWRPGLDSASDTLVRDDLLRLREFHGAKVLVTLLEKFEMKRLAIPELLSVAEGLGIRSVWFPIPDVSVPSDLAATADLVDEVLASMSRGNTVVVHCRGGLGRSGTIAACCLVTRGRPAGRCDPLGQECAAGSRRGGVPGGVR